MEQLFYNWPISISAIALLMALFESLLPSGKIKRFARVVLGLVMILAILRPLYDIILFFQS